MEILFFPSKISKRSGLSEKELLSAHRRAESNPKRKI
jgi:hypothetical protein